MDLQVILTCALIIIARLVDVSLGTLRTHCVVRGYRAISWVIGFVEVTVWVVVVSRVINSLDNPWYVAAYAFGFATGNVLGINLDRRLAIGEQVLRVFSPQGKEMATTLRGEGVRVTVFHGEGMRGPVDMLFIQSKRKSISKLIRRVRDIDPKCFYIIDDVQFASQPLANPLQPTGWRAVLKKK
ncbi:MAG: DUF2179 domain-containing protein [Phycisphaerales bacterium]